MPEITQFCVQSGTALFASGQDFSSRFIIARALKGIRLPKISFGGLNALNDNDIQKLSFSLSIPVDSFLSTGLRRSQAENSSFDRA